ncbi:hypothetical protein PQ455_15390 [Sphingomonas naphthae]|uniref:Glycosyltransferase family 17 n=1 Tax=Sphingomonas naphthae TaxID=1813468 RepID=A0ABY7TL83_9SPHN|nr:hypothetical protein [Sphingomonas naphthae]WCT73004.1 hypothetical protein PQ455_15390 [Sphingomonas naphthae]
MKVYDCFMVFNEIDLLEIRLNELDPVIDVFVIVESNTTFQGDAKPLHFQDNKERFARFLPKIRHFVFDGRYDAETPWQREFGQRNALSRGFEDAADADIIIISDVDEIVRADVVKRIQPVEQITFLQMETYIFYLNWVSDVVWNMAYAAPAQYIRRYVPDLNAPRFERQTLLSDDDPERRADVMGHAGWHLSWLGGSEKILLKMNSFSHVEPEARVNVDPVKILRSLEKRSFFGIHQLSVTSLDRLPRAVRENADYLRANGFIFDEPTAGSS